MMDNGHLAMRHTSRESKACEVCGEVYYRKQRESDKTWAARRSCGSACSNKLRWGDPQQRAHKKDYDTARAEIRRERDAVRRSGKLQCCCCHSVEVNGACADCGRPVCDLCKEGKRDLCSECNGSMFV